MATADKQILDKQISPLTSSEAKVILRETKVDQKFTDVPLEDLSEAFKAILEKAKTRRFASSSRGITSHFELRGEKTLLVLPRNFVKLGSILAKLIEALAFKLSMDVATYETERSYAQETNDQIDQYFLGVYEGLTLTEGCPNRDITKRGFELGKTSAYHLRVKEEFVDNEYLTINALEGDTFFYGNHEESTGKRDDRKKKLDIKAKIISTFKVGSEGEEIYHIIHQFASRIKLSELGQDVFEREIAKNIVKVNSLLKQFSRPIPGESKKGKQKEKKGPTFPKKSPLFLNEEMKLIRATISNSWEGLPENQQDFVESVQTRGYKKTLSDITSLMNERWAIIGRFAHQTTQRLQKIRKSEDNAELRKAAVTMEMVKRFLKQDEDKVENFFLTLSYISGNLPLRQMVRGLNKGVPKSEKIAERILKKNILKAYVIEDQIEKKDDIKIEEEVDMISEKGVQNSIKLILESYYRQMTLHNNVKALEDLNPYKFPGRARQLIQIIPKLQTFENDLESGERDEIEMAKVIVDQVHKIKVEKILQGFVSAREKIMPLLEQIKARIEFKAFQATIESLEKLLKG